MYDVIIIGAGPSGLTSALYALRANKKVLLLEKGIYGGQIINASIIENYPALPNISGFLFASNLYNQVMDLGLDYKNEEVIRIERNKVITKGNSYDTKSIIIATGCDNRKLNINEDKYIGKGVSYCATCDGNFYKGKDVAVVGGGNTALEEALYLSSICNKVYLIHRGNTFKGEQIYIDKLKEKDNVDFIFNSNVIKLNGDTLESIDLDNNSNILVSGLFIAIGKIPMSNIFKGFIDLDENGYINSVDGVHTNIEGIYVCGDVRKKELRQLTTAVSDGSVAATTAIKEMK